MSLYEQNLQFLSGVSPALAARLREIEPTVTKPVYEGDAIVNIDLGGRALYGVPAAEFAAQQVNAYLKKPTRILVNAPVTEDMHDPCCLAMKQAMEGQADVLAQTPPEDRCGVLFVAGIGLGAHLAHLIAATNPSHVILVEPIGEFVAHSLAAVDWRPFWMNCIAAGATVDIIVEQDMSAIVHQMEALLSRFGGTAIDGSYIYMHYHTDMVQAVAAKFHELSGMTAILRGYYADEELMVGNTVSNVTKHDFWLIEGTPALPLDVPAFVVGAGPSLDGAIETIRRHKDHAVIISAGSTLEALLEQGIVPDFHVEKENTETTVKRLRHIHKRYGRKMFGKDFGSIRLIASTTVRPGVTDLFDEKFLFLRTDLSSSQMFGAGHHAVSGTSPYSANAALTMAAILGFREIYLFGCDCGTRDAGRHHAAQTAYFTLDDYAPDWGKFPLRAPANFGGEVGTNTYFSWSRWTHEQVIAGYGLDVANCSDGAAIAGARPLPPENMPLAGPQIDKMAFLNKAKTGSTFYMAGQYLAEQDVAGTVASWHDLAAALRGEVDALVADGIEPMQAEERLIRFFEGASQRYGGLATIISGSARAMLPVAGYYLDRAPDDATRALLRQSFHDTYKAQIDAILDAGSRLMDGLNAPDKSGLREAG